MDSLTLLSKVHDTERVSEDALERGRAALLRATDSDLRRPSARRARRTVRRVGFGALGALGAAALVATLVVTDLPGWRGGAEPAAAAVLHHAATTAISASDPAVGPGQYLKISTTAIYTTSGETEDREIASYQERSTDQLYLPADLTEEWVWIRDVVSIEATFGSTSERVADYAARVRAEERGTEAERLRAAGGQFYGGGAHNGPEQFTNLPRDPRLLLAYIRIVTFGAGPSADGEALVWIGDALRTGLVPSDLRATMFEAAALVPGVTMLDGEANLAGQTGVSIGRDEANSGTRYELIINPESGLLIGERTTLLDAKALPDVPAGTVTSWTAVSTEVVDVAPAGGTPNGAFDLIGCEVVGVGRIQCPVE